MNRGAVRTAAIAVLGLDAAALLLAFIVAAGRPDPAPIRGSVVESRCSADGTVIESIDDGNPAGLLAQDTGVSC